MKVALLQYNPVWENIDANKEKINGIIDTQLKDEELIIFPEMTLTGFTMEATKFAEDIDGPATIYFIELARKIKRHLFAGIIERDGDKIFNSLYHFDSNGLITARYRKIHPFSMSKENEYFAHGNKIVTTKINQTKIGLTICYDLRFPELYRMYAKAGADIIINIASWPDKRIEHWKVLLRAHAILNQCFVIGVNRTGSDPYYNYVGWSGAFDPLGYKIEMIEDEEKLISLDLDLGKIKETREKLPFLKDMKLI